MIIPISQKVKSTIIILNTASGEITDPSAIANEFNNYFVNIGTEIASSHQTNCSSTISTKYLSNALPSSIFLEPPSVSKIFNLIHTLNFKKVLETMKYQCTYYVFLLKLSHLYYATYLRMFMNSVFFRCVSKPQKYLQFLKQDTKRKKQIIDQYLFFQVYQNISIGKQTIKRLSKFFEKHKVICENQFEFRENCTTEHALLKIITQCFDIAKDKYHSCLIMLDIRLTL